MMKYLLRGFFLTALFALVARAGSSYAATTIKPGEIWPDDRGQHINAHGGGVIKVGDTWYWFGECRPKNQEPDKRYVSCYSSTDLINWKFRNLVINSTAPDGLGPHWVLERPKVYYNDKTKKFVMWMHIDGPANPNETDPHKSHGYDVARVGVAVSDTVDGDYKFVRTFRPLGKESRDIGQFIDDDGTAYLIFESRPTGGFYISRLTDDYLDVAEETCFIHAPMEGGALLHLGNLYYVLGSSMSGWWPNPNKYATATSLKGPWSPFTNIAPPETKTYGSQSTMLLKITGSKATTVIFMGDIWKPSAQWDSRYLWMPLETSNGKLWLPAPKEWTLDAQTGESAVVEPQAP